MIVSPALKCWATSAIVESVTDAGTITQTVRGAGSFAAKSAIEDEVTEPSVPSAATASAERSNTVDVIPCFARRRTILAPMRPRPTIAKFGVFGAEVMG